MLLTIAGAVLVAIAVRDAFDALLHPEGRGALGRGIMRAVWTLFRALPSPRRRLPLAGPLALTIMIGAWATLLAVGWALILWPHLEDGFRPPGSAGGRASTTRSTSRSTTLTTTGSAGCGARGVLAARGRRRCEALLGFGLLSASVSYLLLIYPVLAPARRSRMRCGS